MKDMLAVVKKGYSVMITFDQETGNYVVKVYNEKTKAAVMMSFTHIEAELSNFDIVQYTINRCVYELNRPKN